ncbi:hypothetical protein ACFCYM_34950 [Streptomyces sp. NPDC056254]|uniref:hypothetical protein n=1 Tax=Streptomyces sp. NPDC056254 TaxID=3345763 RepID=UPI0035DCFCAB
MLTNRYLNLQSCDYRGAWDFTTTVNTLSGYAGSTHASNTPDTTLACAPPSGGWAFAPANSGFKVLDTLDSTRGRGFVEFRMTAPFPEVTTPYDQTASMTGAGDSAGKITVLVEPFPTEGDWGFPRGMWQVPVGHKLDPFIEVTCDPQPSVLPVPDTTPCQYGAGMRISIRALNGSNFLDNAVTGGADTRGAQWDLNLKSTGARVGTCYVEEGRTSILCRVVKTGTANAGDSLVTSVPVEMLTANTAATPSFQVTWWNPWGEPQRGTNGKNDLWGANDFFTIATTPRA